MRLHRFYVLQPLGEEVVIEDVSTIKQWLKVFRYRSGDFVILFNGDGNDYIYRLNHASPSSCTLFLTEKKSAYIPQRKSYLFLTLIKKDLFELVVEKSVELGVTDIIPMITERTEKKKLSEERLTSIIKESTEQSGRGDILTLHPQKTLKEIPQLLEELEIPKENVYPATLLGKNLQEILAEKTSAVKNMSPLVFLVGPEGGWTDNEEKLFKESGFSCISLGKTVLRAETAGITCALLSDLL